MHLSRPILLALCLGLVLPPLAVAVAQEPQGPAPQQQAPLQQKREKPDEAESRYLRLVRDKNKEPVALQAAIVRFAPEGRRRKAATVDLVAAVHVAEKSYYEQLNREFGAYDAVLYELVAPEGTKIRKGQTGRADNPVSLLQHGMKRMLELEFQLEAIDYTPEHFVHADMSPEQFAQTMQQRGESMLGTFLRMMGYAMARQQGSGKTSDAQLLLALFDKNRALALKRLLAEQFEEMEGSMLALDGPQGSTIITERNKVALAVLREQIDAGKRRIAIFYGAGHMPDLEERLRDDFDLEPVRTRWLDAWQLQQHCDRDDGRPQGKPATGGRSRQEGATAEGDR